MNSINDENTKLYERMVLINEDEYKMLKAANDRSDAHANKDNNQNVEINNLILPESLRNEQMQNDPPQINEEKLTSQKLNDKVSPPHSSKRASSSLIRIVEKGKREKDGPASKNQFDSDKLHTEDGKNGESEKNLKEQTNELGRKILKPKRKIPPTRKRKHKHPMSENEEDAVGTKKKSKIERQNSEEEEPMDTTPSESLKKAKFKNFPLIFSSEKNVQSKAVKRAREEDGKSSKRAKLGQSASEYIQQRYSQLKGEKRHDLTIKRRGRKEYKGQNVADTADRKGKKRRKENGEENGEIDDEEKKYGKKVRDRLSYLNVRGKRGREQFDDLDYFARKYQPPPYKKKNLSADDANEGERILFDNEGDYIMI